MKISRIKPLANVALCSRLASASTFIWLRKRCRSGQTASGYVDGVMHDVKAHAGAAEQNDDITMLVIRYTEE